MIDLTGGLNRAYACIAASIEAEVMQAAPVVTSNLANSIIAESRPNSRGTTIVITMVDYGGFLNEGTGIFGPSKQPIVPKTAKALNTPFGFFKHVKGVEPMRFVEKGVEQVVNSGEIEQEIGKVFDEINVEV